MYLKVLQVGDLTPALYGLGLSYGVTSGLTLEEFRDSEKYLQMLKRSYSLAHLGDGHNKFLRVVPMCLDIKAPLSIWKHIDQYKVGVTTLSESTMHTLMKRQLTAEDFDEDTSSLSIRVVNNWISAGEFSKAVSSLPCGFLQQRVFACNLQVLQNVVNQRSGHKLGIWKFLLSELKRQIPKAYTPYIFKENQL